MWQTNTPHNSQTSALCDSLRILFFCNKLPPVFHIARLDSFTRQHRGSVSSYPSLYSPRAHSRSQQSYFISGIVLVAANADQSEAYRGLFCPSDEICRFGDEAWGARWHAISAEQNTAAGAIRVPPSCNCIYASLPSFITFRWSLCWTDFRMYFSAIIFETKSLLWYW